MDEKQRYKAAQKRVEAKLGFYIHAFIYLIVNGVLMAVDLSTSPDKTWFIWPLLGWGIGLLGHALLVFLTPQSGSLKERMIAKELEKQK